MTELISHVLGELSNYLSGKLSRGERKRVEEHLNGCEECRRHCEDLSRMRKMVYPPPVYWIDRIPVKTLVVLAVVLGLYLAAGKLRKTFDLPKAPAKPAAASAKPAPPQETPAPAPAPAPEVTPTPKPVPRVLPEWQGQYSGINEPRTVTIQTRDEWARLWQEHHAQKPALPPVPELDFSQVTLIGVYGGSQPVGSPAVDIYEIQTLPDQLLVRYGDTAPPPNSDPTVTLIQPYHLKVIPKTTLPVHFERQSTTPPTP